MITIKGTHILLVGGDLSVALLAAQAALSAVGYTTVIVADAHEAWRRLVQGSYGAIILDATCDLTEACLITRMLRRRWSLPILLLGKGSQEASLQCLRAGADAWLRVPFDPHELVARVQGLLRRAAWNDARGDRAPVQAKAP